MQTTQPSDREIVISRRFAAPIDLVFDTLTQAAHQQQWMEAAGMKLVSSSIDLRPGGTSRHVYRRPSGRLLEVRGLYERVDAPRGYTYIESYDFSPLQIQVTVELTPAGTETQFRQTLLYATRAERDADMEGVVTSSLEAFERLDSYLSTLPGTR